MMGYPDVDMDIGRGMWYNRGVRAAPILSNYKEIRQ